ncbi:amidase [Acetobacter oeni]|uniref:Amidase n=1 Tax=Acetobacter oeni TaxID=304077 RepID=A0A511XL47_9PROT|nr:amidase [Acetobacter oeni]MBB3883217.1 amidase [Acetobacter oeni]NHO19283.1 amidase [Acetobacter oeni]GBR07284.1 amidase [Acetobacter oeni LMG 21952]GEN63634.1 amidase [Acetobacter oeni]
MMNGNGNRRARLAKGFRAGLFLASLLVGTPVYAGTFTLTEATIAQMQEAMASGALTSTELTTLYLNRIYVFDKAGIRLNAVPVMNPQALAEAMAADRVRAAGGPVSPLLGIPFTVKDSYKVAGLTVAAGSPAFASLIANEDAFTVGRIRAAGGVLLGKTNMPPLAAGGMQRGVYGRAESPYNEHYLTAAYNSGSSNGSASSTSASLAAFGMGEETVSSGRSPSSNNALVAYTPSRGVLSIRGNWPLYPIKDVVVPMTRSTDDLLKVLNVIVADDPVARGDFWREQTVVALPRASQVRPADYESLKDAGALRGKRIGVPTMYIGKDRTGRQIAVRPSILALWEKAASDLRALGAEVVEVDFPLMHNYDMDRPSSESFVSRGLIPADWFRMKAPGQAADDNYEFRYLNPWSWGNFLTDDKDPNIPDWRAVNPDLVFPNPPGSVDAARRGPFRDYRQARDTILAGVKPYDQIPGFAQALRGAERIRKVDFEDWLDRNRLDFIVFPANADIGAANADVDPQAYDHATENGVGRSNTNAMLRHLGIPSVSVSMGLMGDTGMPVNLTFAGKAYDDSRLLSYAYAYEQGTKNRRAPGRVHPLADETVIWDPASVVRPGLRQDREAPLVDIVSVGHTGRHGETIEVSGTARDASGLRFVRVYVNGRKVSETKEGVWHVSFPVTYAVDGGLFLEVLAKDTTGNAGAVWRDIF